MAAGTALRIVLAFTTRGQPWDIQCFVAVREALSTHGLHAYAAIFDFRWPYPPGFFPFVGLAGAASDVTGLAYTSLIRLPSILADAGIALIVQDFLGRHGAGERRRLAATALIALGPSFIVISGFHGQIDNTAILPAVAALAVWDRVPEGRREIYAGALIGLAGAIKITPLILLLALLPHVRSVRSAVMLLGSAAAVPLLITAPFALATPYPLRHALSYHGYPGTSPLSILLEPGLAHQMQHGVWPRSGALFLWQHGQIFIPAALLAVTALTWRRPFSPVDRAVVLYLTFYVVTPSFYFQYLVWGLPFIVMSGRLRLALLVQALAIPPTLLFYLAPWKSDAAVPAYFVAMVAFWLVMLGALVYLAGRRPGARPLARLGRYAEQRPA
ncbi:MAG: hypothetical protein QOF37_1917 [Thermoleophilaceae bacterium]|nr:hypothetical protein [Thermoleophilaceae bacterium]